MAGGLSPTVPPFSSSRVRALEGQEHAGAPPRSCVAALVAVMECVSQRDGDSDAERVRQRW